MNKNPRSGRPPGVDFFTVFRYDRRDMGGNAMNQNPHWKQLIWNWASIIFGNALYSLAVALSLEPSGLITGGSRNRATASE